MAQRHEARTAVGGGWEGADGKQKFEDWALPNQRRHCVLVTSYETLRSHANTVQKATGGIDLLVCDEAHRLKNTKGDTQTIAALRALRCDRRVLLTGTPIQNDLGEFFAVMDFACPGLLGDASVFKKVFSNPVEASRDKHATAEEKRIGAARSAELGRMTREFVHRASARDVNAKHLPPKTEYVVFVRPSPVQAALYRAVLRRGARDGHSRSGASAAAEAVQQRVAADARAGARARKARNSEEACRTS